MDSVAKILGCNRATVRKYLKLHGIQAKPHARSLRPKISSNPYIRDKEWLRDQYVNQKKSLYRIGREIKACPTTIKQALESIGVTMRDCKTALKLTYPHGRKGEQASNWRGGRIKTSDGYTYLYRPDHPNATKEGYVMEHRLVMEKKLGRYLERNEHVDHDNTDKSDNRPENLEVLTPMGHVRKHYGDRKRVIELKKRVAHLEALLRQHGIPFDSPPNAVA